jgi:hypothetical protein
MTTYADSADGRRHPCRITTMVQGPGEPVLVVDFAQFNVEGTLSGLMAEPGDRTVYRIDPASDLGDGDGPVPIPMLAADYADEVGRLRPAPTAVLAFCSAATLAMHLVQRMTGDGSPEPTTILVEPTWPTPAMVADDVVTVRRSLGAQNVDPRPDVRSVESIVDVLRADVLSTLTDEDLAQDREFMLDLLTARYGAWFGFLLGTMEAPVPPAGRRLHVVTSLDAGPDTTTASRLPGRRPLVVPVSRAKLLVAPSARRLLGELLDSACAGRGGSGEPEAAERGL